MAACLCVLTGSAADTPSQWRVYFGGYTAGKSRGIYLAHFDESNGILSKPELAVETRNPSFLALHPNGRTLYAVGETNDATGKKIGAVNAFAVDGPTGKLTFLNRQPSGGIGPCHVSVDSSGRCVLAANYGSGSIEALPLQSDGRLGASGFVIQHHGSSIDTDRQSGPHAHFITPDPSNRFIWVCDLGLDKVFSYRLAASPANTLTLVPNHPPSTSIAPGSGPRHLAFSPDGKHAYLINEIASTLVAFAYDAEKGTLQELQTISSLPLDYHSTNTAAEVQVHPSGRFLFASNRGHNSIASFAIDPRTGKLTLLGHQSTQGKTPRFFTLTPSGRWLLAANQNSDSVVLFGVNASTGQLTPTGQVADLGSPSCAVFSQKH